MLHPVFINFEPPPNHTRRNRQFLLKNLRTQPPPAWCDPVVAFDDSPHGTDSHVLLVGGAALEGVVAVEAANALGLDRLFGGRAGDLEKRRHTAHTPQKNERKKQNEGTENEKMAEGKNG